VFRFRLKKKSVPQRCFDVVRMSAHGMACWREPPFTDEASFCAQVVGLEVETESNSTYRSLLSHLPGGQVALEEAYSAIDKIMREVMDYVGMWLRYQSLWDLRMDQLYERLGRNLSRWMATLEDIK